jgi:hypothetical protein
VIFFETYSVLFLVFSNSPCRETPKNALKKKKVRTYFFLRAGADVRRFLVLFSLPPLAVLRYTTYCNALCTTQYVHRHRPCAVSLCLYRHQQQTRDAAGAMIARWRWAMGDFRFQISISNPISMPVDWVSRGNMWGRWGGAATRGIISQGQGPPRSSHFSASQQPASRSHSPQPPPPPPTHSHTCALELFTHRNLVATRLLL